MRSAPRMLSALRRRWRREVDRIWLGPRGGRSAPPIGDVADAHEQLAVVVLSLGATPSLVDAVRSLSTQVPCPEIVVVSSGGLGARDLLDAHGLDAAVVETDHVLLPGAARNVGIAASHAPFIAFLAADCTARTSWVAHRLAHHLAGADVVASPVVNGHPESAIAAAAHVLLFSTRLPGTHPSRRARYGASYARTVFARFGRFRGDLRTGEDTELHARFDGSVRWAFSAQTHTVHDNPTSPRAFFRDQFLRGRRAAHAHRSLATGATAARVAADAIMRVPRVTALSFRATPAKEWSSLLRALPFLVPGAVAYATGAGTARHPRPPTITPPSPAGSRPRLLAVVQARNERRFLDGYLANVPEQVDGIVVLDDGSTDGTAEAFASHPAVLEVLRLPPRSPHVWNELRNRRLLIDAAGRHRADWVIAIDVDERLERDFRLRANELIAHAERRGIQAYSITIRELWDRHDQSRIDGVWGQKKNARLFRYRADHDFGSKAFHGIWAPENSRQPNGGFAHADLFLYHLRMIHGEDRRRRMQRYKRLDPESKWQAIGYDYLNDEAGLVLERIPPERRYVPFEMPDPPEGDEHPFPTSLERI